MARQRYEVVATRTTRTIKPVFDSSLAGSCPSSRRLDRMSRVAKLPAKRSTDHSCVLAPGLMLNRGKVHNCALPRNICSPIWNNCALLSRHDALLCVYTGVGKDAVDHCTAPTGAGVAPATPDAD